MNARKFVWSLATVTAILTLPCAALGEEISSEAALAVKSQDFPRSERSYRRAGTSRAFTATEPFVIDVMGADAAVTLYRAPRSHDFSGDVPFINPSTGVADPGLIQAWSPDLQSSRNMTGDQMTNAGFPGRVEKRDGTTMVRYVAGDGVTAGTCRTQMLSYPIPPRTQVRWELEVAFGANDRENGWALTRPMESRVLFWQVKSNLPGNPSMQAVVDTDPDSPTDSLVLTFFLKGGKATNFHRVATVGGIPRNTQIPIVIEAFLDERSVSEGGKGRMKVWVNGKVAGDVLAPTLQWGPSRNTWAIAMYLYNEKMPYRHTRASFWKVARMVVEP